MTRLRPCSECQRHVRVDESACPFCDAELEPVEPARRGGSAVTRAAIFAGATLLAAPGCGDKTPEPKNPDDKVETTADAAPPDAPVEPPPPDDRNIPKPYGAPPNRDRAV